MPNTRSIHTNPLNHLYTKNEKKELRSFNRTGNIASLLHTLERSKRGDIHFEEGIIPHAGLRLAAAVRLPRRS